MKTKKMTADQYRSGASAMLIMALSIAAPLSSYELGEWWPMLPLTALLGWLCFEFKRGAFRCKKAFLVLNLSTAVLVGFLCFMSSENSGKFAILVVTLLASLTCALNSEVFAPKSQ